MRLLVICGDHPRHRFVANKLADHFNVCGVLIQEREPLVQIPPDGLSQRDRQNFKRHFQDREATEFQFFGHPERCSAPNLVVDSQSLNQDVTLRFLLSLKADSALVFGTGLLGIQLLRHLPQHTLNLHLGLSPRYRGAATLFWPFYFLEPAWAGATLHYLVSEPDAGDIVHQVCPPLYSSDGIHDVGCRTVVTAMEDILFVFNRLAERGRLEIKKQKGTGRNFLSRDFHAQHLRVIYDLYENKLVQAFLEGELPDRRPVLFGQPGCGT